MQVKITSKKEYIIKPYKICIKNMWEVEVEINLTVPQGK